MTLDLTEALDDVVEQQLTEYKLQRIDEDYQRMLHKKSGKESFSAATRALIRDGKKGSAKQTVARIGSIFFGLKSLGYTLAAFLTAMFTGGFGLVLFAPAAVSYMISAALRATANEGKHNRDLARSGDKLREGEAMLEKVVLKRDKIIMDRFNTENMTSEDALKVIKDFEKLTVKQQMISQKQLKRMDDFLSAADSAGVDKDETFNGAFSHADIVEMYEKGTKGLLTTKKDLDGKKLAEFV